MVQEPNREGRKKRKENDEQKWFAREEIQDFAKIGGQILKKTVATGKDVFKEVKENFPKEAGQLLAKGKEELLKGLSQEMARNIITFTVEKIFRVASEHSLEFSIRIRRNKEKEKDKDKH